MKKCDSLFALFLFNIKHNWVYIDTLVCIDSIQLSDSTYWKKGKKKTQYSIIIWMEEKLNKKWQTTKYDFKESYHLFLTENIETKTTRYKTKKKKNI